MTSRAFTLIEVLIAMALTTIGLVFVTYFAADIGHFGTDLNTRLTTQRELEVVLRTMISEIRSMGPGGNGAYPVATATATTFTFYSDIEGDGKFDQVRYFLSGSLIKKGATKPTATEPVDYPPANEVVTDVVHYVTSTSLFTYYPEGLPSETGPLSSPVDVASVRLITISATTDEDTTKSPSATTLSITTTIRNLRGDI